MRTMNNLAWTCKQQGHPDKAEEMDEAVFEKRRATLGSDHPDMLLTMNNLALTYLASGSVNRAFELPESAMCERRIV